MKLFEIVNTNNTPTNTAVPNENTHNKIGSGYYAAVYDHKTDPHMVTKHITGSDSAYETYIKLLNQNDRMGSNPYFPRIYSADGQTGVVELEKLSPIESINSAELGYLITTAFGSVENLAKISRDFYTTKLSQTTDKAEKRKLFTSMYASALDAIVQGNTPINAIANKELAQAIKILQSIDTNAIYGDISPDNIMIRRGPAGVQMVLTDPIAEDEYYSQG